MPIMGYRRKPNAPSRKYHSTQGETGVLTVGMGPWQPRFMAGVDLVRRKKAQPVGSLTQLGTIRLGKRTEGRAPLIHDFVPLEKLENLVFGSWDIFPDTAYEAARMPPCSGLDTWPKSRPCSAASGR